MTETELRWRVDGVLDAFDFDAVHRYMQSVQWTWSLKDPHVPTVDELRARARGLLLVSIQYFCNGVTLPGTPVQEAGLMATCSEHDLSLYFTPVSAEAIRTDAGWLPALGGSGGKLRGVPAHSMEELQAALAVLAEQTKAP